MSKEDVIYMELLLNWYCYKYLFIYSFIYLFIYFFFLGFEGLVKDL